MQFGRWLATGAAALTLQFITAAVSSASMTSQAADADRHMALTFAELRDLAGGAHTRPMDSYGAQLGADMPNNVLVGYYVVRAVQLGNDASPSVLAPSEIAALRRVLARPHGGSGSHYDWFDRDERDRSRRHHHDLDFDDDGHEDGSDGQSSVPIPASLYLLASAMVLLLALRFGVPRMQGASQRSFQRWQMHGINTREVG